MDTLSLPLSQRVPSVENFVGIPGSTPWARPRKGFWPTVAATFRMPAIVHGWRTCPKSPGWRGFFGPVLKKPSWRVVFTVGLLVIMGGWHPVPAKAQSASGAHSLRMDLNDSGTIIIKSLQNSPEGQLSQVLLEKPGGSKTLLVESTILQFTTFLQGDLDGDQIPELVIIARNPTGDDYMPYIFKGQAELKQVFPPRGEGNPIIGKEISIIPAKDSSHLCVKVLVNHHDFGPPDLFTNEFFMLRDGKLIKVGEKIQSGSHFNQRMNLAALFFHAGDFLEASRQYQWIVAASETPILPAEAKAECLFYQAEAKKFLKDFRGAANLYTQVFTSFASSPVAVIASQEASFLNDNLKTDSALSLYIDVYRLHRNNKGAEALSMLDRGLPILPKDQMGDFFQFLRGEILMGNNRGDEALKIFRELLVKFPKTRLASKIKALLEELRTSPDEVE